MRMTMMRNNLNSGYFGVGGGIPQLSPNRIDVGNEATRRIAVNKTTHRIRFENETESEVVIVIEEKNEAQ